MSHRPGPGGAPRIRLAEQESQDPRACAEVYAPYVARSAISFEYEPPSAEEMRRRMLASYAWLIAEHEGRAIGYAYGAAHAAREAYRWAADVAIYIEAAGHRGGVGRALYTRLFSELRAAGVRVLCAGVTQPNDASNALHRAVGFTPVGTFRRIGWKAGAWHDVLWLQLELCPEAPGGPSGPVLTLAERPPAAPGSR